MENLHKNEMTTDHSMNYSTAPSMNDMILATQSITPINDAMKLSVIDPALLATSDIQPTSQQTAAVNDSMNQMMKDATPLGDEPGNFQDSMRMEEDGFIGFESPDEVLHYLKFKDEIFIESVIVVEPYGPHNAARVQAEVPQSFLSIPTRHRGSVIGVFPEQSPHAKDLALFDKHDQGFAEWWITSGGKFHMLAMNHEFSHMPINFNFQMSTNVNVHAPLNINIGMPQNTSHVAPPNVPAAYQQNSASGGPSESAKNTSRIATPKPGLYQDRALPAGALRIWSEIGAQLPQVSHRSEHPIYSHAPFYTVDLRLLGDVYITAHELLTWFPDHLGYWPDLIHRLAGGGWTDTDMIKFVYVVRGMTSSTSKEDARMAERDRSRIGHYRGDLGVTQTRQGTSKVVPRPYADLTCANWQDPRRATKIRGGDIEGHIDYYVSDLADGVLPAMYPTGVNAGALTDVIRLVKDFPNDAECQALKLSGVSEFAKQMGLFQTVADAGLPNSVQPGGAHADSTALAAAAALVRRPGYEVSITGTYGHKPRTLAAKSQSTSTTEPTDDRLASDPS
ncbi:uncharacterized protein N0V89_005328 [Didymosphaeria variabile]|uniref:Uncharacterized protein n=1 Tax=Didymosphaeria variabile TaxID=1932322 RepID=A0A9W8XMP3_9PLEO|nr:uncharacterized protein N0V89_005328 [Didymosphaeria variabile]KAJ4353598.1 hypothetical protein N0V89_005328 [Didymosphaeria variabile]